MFSKVNKFLSVVMLIGFIVSPFVDADVTPAQPTSQASQQSQVAADTPQSSYVPAATTYQNNDAIPILNNQAYDPTIYSSFIPQDAVQQYVSQYSGNGFAGQALEGFLIPTVKHEVPVSPTSVALLKAFLPAPKLIIALLTKLIALAATAAGILLFGGAITSFVCAFTPLCTITFFGRPLDLLRQETKDIVDKIGSEITPERIKRAADLMRMAVEKYQNMK